MGLRICMISDHGDPLAPLGDSKSGGQNQYVYQLALHLGRLGHRVDVFTHWSRAEAPEVEPFGEGVRVIRIAAGRKGDLEKSDLYSRLDRFYSEMRAKIPSGKYDVVHAHYWMSGLLGLKLRGECGYPLVYTPHSLGMVKGLQTGQWDWERLWRERSVLVDADHVVVTTETERDLAREFCGKTPIGSVSVIPAGVAGHFFEDPDPPTAESRRPDAERDRDCGAPFGSGRHPKPYVLYVGRLTTEKGLGVLMEAYSMWAARNPDVPPLWIAGGDAYGRDWKRWSNNFRKLGRWREGDPKRIRYLGPVDNKRLPRLYRDAAMVVVPSWYESFGLVAAEAMAAGGVVIASDVGGLRHIVQDGVTGRLVPPKNPEILARVMEETWSCRDCRETYRRKGKSDARRRFAWPAIAQRVVDVYLAEAAKKPVSL